MSILNLKISASADDEWGDGTSGSQSYVQVNTTNSLGTNNAGDTKPRVIALRFTGVTIPQGATINSAVLKLSSDGNWSRTVGVWFGEAADNSAAYAGTADEIANRTVTTASVTWDENINRTAGVFYDVPSGGSWAPIVQEIVNRAGWASGNALSMFGKGSAVASFASQIFRMVDNAGADGATLDIDYTAPGSPFTRDRWRNFRAVYQ